MRKHQVNLNQDINPGKQIEIKSRIDPSAEINLVDKDGYTGLHQAVRRRDFIAVKQLLKDGARTYCINHNFQTPLQQAMSDKDPSQPIITELLRYQSPTDSYYLEDRIAFCLIHYDDELSMSSEKNRALLDYTVSCLIGADVNEIAYDKEKQPVNLLKYLAHSLSLEGEKKDAAGRETKKLEGMYKDAFLSLRIRQFFEIYIKIKLNILPRYELPWLRENISAEMNQSNILKLLFVELLTELQTLHICQSAYLLHFGYFPGSSGSHQQLISNTDQRVWRTALARNIGDYLQKIENGQEFTFAGGWLDHTLYINFIRESDNIIIWVDNLGSGCDYGSTSRLNDSKQENRNYKNFHVQDTVRRSSKGSLPKLGDTQNRTYLYPAVLGVTRREDFNHNLDHISYLESLISNCNMSSINLKEKWNQLLFVSSHKEIKLEVLSDKRFETIILLQKKENQVKAYWIRSVDNVNRLESMSFNLKEEWHRFFPNDMDALDLLIAKGSESDTEVRKRIFSNGCDNLQFISSDLGQIPEKTIVLQRKDMQVCAYWRTNKKEEMMFNLESSWIEYFPVPGKLPKPPSSLMVNMMVSLIVTDMIKQMIPIVSTAVIDHIVLSPVYEPNFLTILEEEKQKLLFLPSSKKQSAGNCTGKNHQVGLHYRLGKNDLYVTTDRTAFMKRRKKVYQWLREKEREQIDPKREKLDAGYYKKFWSKEDCPRSKNPLVNKAIRRHYRSSIFQPVLGLIDSTQEIGGFVFLPLTMTKKPLVTPPEKKLPKQPERDSKSVRAETTLMSLNIFSFDKRSTTPSHWRVLVNGVSGVGKTESCYNIIREWARQEDTQQLLFSQIILIPLRHLNDHRYPVVKKPSYSLADIIQKEYADIYEISTEAAQEMQESKDILWILDGYNELMNPYPAQLKQAISELLQRPYLLVTSHPEIFPETTFKFDAIFDLVGFSDECIGKYIRQFFQVSADEKSAMSGGVSISDQLLEFLKTHSNLWQLAYVPLLLDMICRGWKNRELQSQQKTLTQVYQQMIQYLQKNIALKQHAAEHTFLDERSLLMRLAFLSLDQFPMINKDCVAQAVLAHCGEDDPERHLAVMDKALALGIIKLTAISGQSANCLECDYEFIHSSFHQFFAAGYLAKCLKNAKHVDHGKALGWITANKYTPLGQSVVGFLAGLISDDRHESAQSAISLFWKTIHEHRDIVGIHHLFLLLICLEEAGYNPRIPGINQLESQVVKAVQKLLIPEYSLLDQLSRDIINVIKRSPCLFQKLQMQQWIIERLNEPELESIVLEMIKNLGPLVANKKIIAWLVALQKRKPYDYIIIDALGSIGVLTDEVLTLLVELIKQFNQPKRPDSDSVPYFPDSASSAMFVLAKLCHVEMTSEILYEVTALFSKEKIELSSIQRYLSDGVKKIMEARAKPIRQELEVLRPYHYVRQLSDCNDMAYKALYKMKARIAEDPQALSLLFELLLDNKNIVIKDYAIRLLGNVNGTILVKQQGVVKELIGLLADQDDILVDDAKNTLIHIGDAATERLDELKDIIVLLSHHSSKVRADAAYILSHMASVVAQLPEIISRLITLLTDRDGDVQEMAVAALYGIRIQKSEYLQRLILLLKYPISIVRARAVQVFDGLDSDVFRQSEVSSGIIGLLQPPDSDSEVRLCATIALGKMEPDEDVQPTVLSILTQQLEDTNNLSSALKSIKNIPFSFTALINAYCLEVNATKKENLLSSIVDLSIIKYACIVQYPNVIVVNYGLKHEKISITESNRASILLFVQGITNLTSRIFLSTFVQHQAVPSQPTSTRSEALILRQSAIASSSGISDRDVKRDLSGTLLDPNTKEQVTIRVYYAVKNSKFEELSKIFQEINKGPQFCKEVVNNHITASIIHPHFLILAARNAVNQPRDRVNALRIVEFLLRNGANTQDPEFMKNINEISVTEVESISGLRSQLDSAVSVFASK